MGFVGRRNTMIRIQSRFTSDDGRDYFLHYMLQKVFAIHLFDLKHLTDEESIFDFLIYLFPTFYVGLSGMVCITNINHTHIMMPMLEVA